MISPDVVGCAVPPPDEEEQRGGGTNKKDDPNSSVFSDATANEILSNCRRSSRRRGGTAHLSSFLDTFEECHAVDLMKVLKAAL